MYKIFSPETNSFVSVDHLPQETKIVEINHNIRGIKELCDHYGKQIYENHQELNPIFEGTLYFGRNLASFDECLALASSAIDHPIIAVHYEKPLLSEADYLTYLETLKRNSVAFDTLLAKQTGFNFCFTSHEDATQ